MRRDIRCLLLLLVLCLLLHGCADTRVQEESHVPMQLEEKSEEPPADFTPYDTPPVAMSAFHPELATGSPEVKIDLSAVSEGYVAVSAVSANRLKFQVCKDDLTYNYDISSEGTPAIFPLQSGDGLYVFHVLENVENSKYIQIYQTECDVKMLDQFQPFLRPSNYCSYKADSECVRMASQLASSCTDKLDVVSEIYSFICQHIQYDLEKAASVQSGYLPDVDETMLSGKGICFDYAALASAMLRSQGIPTKIVFGYVAPNAVYHAWNMVYTEEHGWITVSFETSRNSWNRIDLTFSAGGGSSEFIGDGKNYTDVYYY